MADKNRSCTTIYRNRQTRLLVEEINQSKDILSWLYQTRLGFLCLRLILDNFLFCWLYGAYQNLPHTRRKIPGFVTFHQIDSQEFELSITAYRSFNAFFSRRLKPNARIFSADPAVLCSPADGKVLIVPSLAEDSRLPVKGIELSPAQLLHSPYLAKSFYSGSAIVVRLAPSDYHRFHFIDDGYAERSRLVSGHYHSIHPVALAKLPDVFLLNKRSITTFVSDSFGFMAYIEIGAIAVGSIQQTYRPGSVFRGQEKGFFQFGGSTVVILIEQQPLVFDLDLINDSSKGIEVAIHAGENMGRKVCSI